ncbi:MAG: DNA polymerase III subunit epsilon [Dactylosporangium sp.]|nr:hypothetical protein [Dactylosporangium sp.]NNJ63191.1 DNA polymerase III subunit epsilon [Dactylosporangium sp.]
MINQYAGTCASCHARVPAQSGQRVNDAGTWKTYHNDCVPVRVAPPAGTHDGWHNGPLVAFDVETTLPEPQDARIISAALCGGDGTRRTWMIDPGVPIPPDATARHHITDAEVQRDGRQPAEALGELGAAVSDHVRAGVPLVAFFASYDMTVLRTELARHALPAVDWSRVLVIDPFVLHKQVEPAWWGKKTLTDLCAYYQVPLGQAHDAVEDATATLGLARAIAARHPRIAGMSLPDLHLAQVEWFAEDARGLQRYYDRKGIAKNVGTEWPLEHHRRS